MKSTIGYPSRNNTKKFTSLTLAFAMLIVPFAQMAAATRGNPKSEITLASETSTPPVVTTNAGTVSYTQCDSPTPVDSGVTVTDSDSGTLASGTVSITANLHAGEDVLAFVNNNGASFGNIQVDSYTSGILSLSSPGATATVAQWQNALQAVTYANTSPNPSSDTRTISFVVNDGTDNSAPATKDVSVTPTPPPITPTPAQVCASSTGNSAAGPAGATSYAWSIVNGTITSATNIQTITYTAGASGTVDLTLVVTNASGCSASNTVNVTINPNPATPTITPGGPTTFCAGGSVTLTSSSASGNQWKLNGNPIGGATSNTYNATAAGSYTVVVTDGNSCTSAASAATTVTVNPLPATPTITPGGPTTFCAGGSVTLTSSSANGNQWLLNGNPIGGATNQAYIATASGNYTVIVTDGNSCTSAPSSATTVTVNPIPATPTITPGGPTTFCAGGSVTLNSSSASGNQWYLNGNPIGGATNQAYVANASGNYTVIASASGCPSAASAATSVTVQPLVVTVLNTNDAGAGSLRQALLDVCAATGTINFDPSLTAGGPATITLTTGELVINNNVTIQGPAPVGLTISGNNASRVFNIGGGASLSISNLTIASGRAASGGGILNAGTLTITNSTISNNQTPDGTNATGAGNGGNSGDGGGLYSTGTLTLISSTISGNKTGQGGDTSGSGNGGNSGDGGGLYSTGPLTLINSTISGNKTGRGGDASGTGNGGNSGEGAGIYYTGVAMANTLKLTNVTITKNQTGRVGAPTGSNTTGIPGSTVGTGGGFFNSGGMLILNNTIVADNRDGFSNPDDITGTVDASSASNLIGSSAGMNGINNGTNGNQIGSAAVPLSPQLIALANNGGPTFTHLPQNGSPVLDAGSNSLAKDQNSNPLTTDQRGAGFDRILNGTVEIGAVEVNYGPPGSTADVGVSKSSNPDQALADTNVTYTITVVNNGPNVATNATLTDPLPAEVTFVSLSSPGGWSCNSLTPGAGGTLTCTNPNLPLTAGAVFTLVVHIKPGTTQSTFVTNQAQVSTSAVDPNSENDSSAASTLVIGPTADVRVTKFASAGTSRDDRDVAYTITVTNGGPSAAVNATLTDTLPLNMTFVSVFSPAGWDCASHPSVGTGGTVNCTNPSLAVTSGQVFTLTGHIPPGASNGTIYNNQATVSSTTSDPGAENNSSAAGTMVVACVTSPVVNTNADSGAGSLRQAIIDACDGETITFDMNQVVSPITLTTGALSINKSLTIQGPGSALLTVTRSSVFGGSNFSIFNIASGTVNISGLTVTNGRAANGVTGVNGGGISNAGTLALSDVTVSGNQTGNGTSGPGGLGGGIYNSGTLSLTNSTISGNRTGAGGGGSGSGGGIFNTGALTISSSTISGNQIGSADNGGQGGGVENTGTFILNNSTISGNTALGDGGGILNSFSGTVTSTNNTITNNRSNTADGVNNSGGGIARANGTITLRNTIVAGNFQGSGTTAGDVNGLVDASSSFNLIGTGGSGGLTNGVNNNQVGVINPGLGALANNGGPTMTHALLLGSPALDAGSNTLATNAGLTTDQRGAGFARILDGSDANATATVDVGAFEAQVSIEDITDKATNEDTQLQFTFNVGDAGSITSVTATSGNTTLVPNNAANIAVTGSGSTRTLTINSAANLFGTATITVTVNGANSQTMSDTFVLTVNPVADTPSVTGASTTLNTQTLSGLVITRNAVDGAEVTNFKITGITNGTLFKNDGTTQINNNDFITVAEGNAGLKFTPANNSTANGAFQAQASLSNVNAGLGGSTATATITVACGPTVVTNSNDTGAGSLRTVIFNACAGATITFDMTAGHVTSPINLTSAELLIDKGLTLQGPGANLLTIQRSTAGGTPQFRVFNVTAANPDVVTFSGLTISNGSLSGGGNGGGILNSSTATLNVTNSVVSNNSTGGGAFAGFGGGIYNNSTGTLNVTGSTLNNNSAAGNSGFGGGILNFGTGTVNVTGSTLNNNSASTQGGGIYNNGIAVVNVINSTLSGNTATTAGGGIFNVQGTINVTNGTISKNSATAANGAGGGIYNNNIAPAAKLGNTIVAGNTAAPAFGPDLVGTFASQGNNLIGTKDSSTGFTNGVNGDIAGTNAAPVNALLGPLAANGGSTQTMALLPGSPAINAGTSSGAPATDQRGISRVGAVDIGAFESRGFTITATSGSGQNAVITTAFAAPLVATVTSAFGEPVAGGVVTFTAPASGASAKFTGGVITATANINGSGAANSGTVTANNLTGSYNVTATAIGITSPANFSLTNTRAASSVTVTSSVNPSDFGQSVTFTATITSAAGTPTGTVQFQVDHVNAGPPVTLNGSGVAQMTTSSIAVGTHPITADYSGDVNFLPSSGAVVGGQVVKPLPSLSINDPSISEGDTGTKTLNFTVTLSTASSLTVTANYATANGTATAPSDYQAGSGTVTFAPGQVTQTVGVTINGDPVFEPNETFTVNLSSPVNTTISKASGTGTILNDDAQGGFISFSAPTYSVNEGNGFLTITVNRTNDVSGPATIDYTTDDTGAPAACNTFNGLASGRCDFTIAPGKLKFAAGETQKTFVVLVNRDAFLEGPETFTVNLSNPTGGSLLIVPSSATVTITDGPGGPPANLIDDASFFVRQHYHDFLNREPDAAGLSFWTNEITSCGADAQCTDVKRVNVSAAFFLSIEFQVTGGTAYLANKAAFGGLPTYLRFESDSQALGRNYVFGQAGAEAIQEANKVAFFNDYVNRPEFTSTYNSLLNGQYVDTLIGNTGVSFTQAERDALVNGLNNSSETRATVLRKIIEKPSFRQAETNRMFVLMEYFGYLRRDPDAAGFNFWLNKINQFNGNFQNADMVKSFIVSGEYRGRFGP